MSVLDNGVLIDEATWSSPNFTPSALVAQVYGLPRVISGVTTHWWNLPAYNPTFDGTCSYLSRSGGSTSAHFVVQGKRVACLVSPENAAWHAGSAEGNAQTIGVELSPYGEAETLETYAALIRWLEKVYGVELTIYLHQHFSATQCPGVYAGKLDEIVALVNGAKHLSPSGTTTPNNSSQAMVFPLGGSYRITQAFNGGAKLATNIGSGHTGTDWACPTGTPVRAVADGRVLWAGYARSLPRTSWADRWYLVGGGYGGLATDAGLVVVIDHGGYLSTYSHLSVTGLKAGFSVSRGQVIGKSGFSGYTVGGGGAGLENPAGAHLHFEIIPKPFAWSNSFYGRVDPILFISSRLLEEDWLAMATEKQVEDAAYRAVRNALRDPFVRQGADAKAIWGEAKTSSIMAVAQWSDQANVSITKRLDNLASAVEGISKRLDSLEKSQDTAPSAPPTSTPTTGVEGVLNIREVSELLREVVRSEIDKTSLGVK